MQWGSRVYLGLTEIKEQQFRGVLGAVVPTRNEKIGTYL
jgi:hypothetical protein